MAPRGSRSGRLPPLGRGVVVVGTASDVGKSFVATGLCRLLARRGYPVQPFKAVNMSLNSVATAAGEEIALAQWVQCAAAGVPASAAANPVLLKPHGAGVEVVLGGRSRLAISSWRTQMPTELPRLREQIRRALRQTRATGRFVVAEGAGSPVELNLRSSDLSNFFVAESLDVPVILVADLERGGALAQVVGTWELLGPDERARVEGIVFNRFRGDLEIFRPAVEWTVARLGVPVLGVLPTLPAAEGRLPPEDSLQLERRSGPPVRDRATVRIGIVRLPHTANFSDFAGLESRGDVSTVWIDRSQELRTLDALLLPGTRRTGDDLRWLRAHGWPAAIARARARGAGIGGVCGGFQLLGEWLDDPSGVDGRPGRHRGLGLLAVRTRFHEPKVVRPVRAAARDCHPWLARGTEVEGYEIHRGRVELRSPSRAIFVLADGARGGTPSLDGTVSPDGRVWGTMLHGVLGSPQSVDGLVEWAAAGGRRSRPSGPPSSTPASTGDALFPGLEATVERVADLLERHLDQRALFAILRGEGRPLTRAGGAARSGRPRPRARQPR